MLSVRKKGGAAGVFLDPPYSGDVRTNKIYSTEDYTVADRVRDWCIKSGQDPKLRIVLSGFDTEHEVLERDHGWRCVAWYKSGFLKGGMGNVNKSGGGTQQRRERLWLSPHCLPVDADPEPEPPPSEPNPLPDSVIERCLMMARSLETDPDDAYMAVSAYVYRMLATGADPGELLSWAEGEGQLRAAEAAVERVASWL
jgi:hypothetical protein